MAQTTFRDERRGSYKFNPKTYLRNRLSVAWSIPRTALKLHCSEEFWWRLYKPGDNIIDKADPLVHEVRSKNPENVLYLGISYSFK